MTMAAVGILPSRDCDRCPRLAEFRAHNRVHYPDFFNAPVPAFGTAAPRLLILGLAPGLKGANRTGRPFTGDYAGDLLYATLLKYGLAQGDYQARADDGVTMAQTRITNAVKCVPPQNKPEPAEIKSCQVYLQAELAAMAPRLRVILALGQIAHHAALTALECRRADYAFAHGSLHRLPNGITLANSYHCSRYNTNTRRLTVEMFDAVFAAIMPLLD